MTKDLRNNAGSDSSRPNNLIQHTTEFALHIVGAYVRPGDIVIDATCGNGHDTLRLAELLWPQTVVTHTATWNVSDGVKTGPTSPEFLRAGRLYAFDLQPEAIEATQRLLREHGFAAGDPDDRIVLACLNHEHIGDYFRSHPISADSSDAAAPEGFAAAIVFNLGYLPGGDKTVITRTDTTLPAVRQALRLLRTGGLLCLTMYSGHPGGAEEKRALLAFASGLGSRQWHVSYISMPNQRKAPPEILLISRKR